MISNYKWEPDPTLKRQQASFELWSQQEQDIFHDLIQHYHTDFKKIAEQLDRTFLDRVFRPSIVERIYREYYQQKSLTNDCVKVIFNQFLSNIAGIVPNFCFTGQRIERHFPGWKSYQLQQKFIDWVQHGFRKLNYYYNQSNLRKLYDYRLVRVTSGQLYGLFYLAQLKPSILEEQNQHFVDICNACRMLVYLLKYWLDNGLFDWNDESTIILRNVQNKIIKIPKISQAEFLQIMEKILFLDTITKVLFGFQPYQYDEEEVTQNPVIELDDEIPERLTRRQFKEVNIKRKDKHNYTQDKKILHPLLYRENLNYGYLSLSYEQMSLISRSELGALLIPYYTLLIGARFQRQVLAINSIRVRRRFRTGEEYQAVRSAKKLRNAFFK